MFSNIAAVWFVQDCTRKQFISQLSQRSDEKEYNKEQKPFCRFETRLRIFYHIITLIELQAVKKNKTQIVIMVKSEKRFIRCKQNRAAWVFSHSVFWLTNGLFQSKWSQGGGFPYWWSDPDSQGKVRKVWEV